MRLRIRVTPRSRHPAVETAADGTLVVKVREPADKGRANEAVVRALAEHFGVPKSSVTILHGAAGRQKLVEVVPAAPS